MKQTITFLFLLVALLVPGNASAQMGAYSYTDPEGLTWYFNINGTNASIAQSSVGYDDPSPSGSTIVTQLIPGPWGGTRKVHIYQGDVLRIPSTVSDGSNNYTVTEITLGALSYLVAEKIIIPKTMSNNVYIFHHLSRRFVLEEGSQMTQLQRWGFGVRNEFLPRKTTLYYDFANATISGLQGGTFFQIFNNTLIFLGAGSITPSSPSFPSGGNRRTSFDIKDNWIVGGVCEKFSLDDAEEFESPHSFIATQASYNRTFSNVAGKAVSTLYLPYPTDLPTGMQAYTLTQKGIDENGDKAFCFSAIPLGTRLEAYKPYLVRITDGANHTLPVMYNVTIPATPKTDDTGQQASSDTDWKFYGTTMFIENPKAYAKKAYYLSGNKWWAVQNGVTNDYIAPFRCFISSPTNATPAKSFLMVLDDDHTTTNIHQLENETEQDVKSGRHTFYSIDGKRMGTNYDALERGQMYVVNGKKFYKF